MESIVEKINSYYEKNYSELEKLHNTLNTAALANINLNNYKILGWESRQAQYARFSAFVNSVDLDNSSILDVGCGLGDLYHFLTSGLNYNIDYIGVDISQKMIDTAILQLELLKKGGLKLPEENTSTVFFECADVFKNYNKSADYVYASGIFNLNLGNNIEFLQKAFTDFKRFSKKGFVCSMLNERSNDKESPYFYYKPAEVVEIAKKLKPSKIKIDDSYLNNDFTIAVLW